MESNDERFLNTEENTLGEWSDGDDDWILGVDENTLGEWSDSDGDEFIRNIEENVQEESVKMMRWIRGVVLQQHYRKKTST